MADSGSPSRGSCASFRAPSGYATATLAVERAVDALHCRWIDAEVPVASPTSWTCSRKGLEKGSAALARAVTRRRQHFPNEFDAFAGQFGGYASDPGDISARPRKARDQARAHWISRVRHHDWDFAGRLLCRLSGGREPSDDYIDFETDQLGGQFGKPVDLSFRRSKLKSNVLPLDVPQISQLKTCRPQRREN